MGGGSPSALFSVSSLLPGSLSLVMCTPEQRRERRTPEKEERKGTPKRKERRGRRAMRSVRREKNTSIEKRMGPPRP
jgi:hypothetical protein